MKSYSSFVFSLFNYIRPNMFVKSINDINPYLFKQLGIKYVFCDLDNTLVPHFTSIPTKSSIDFINKLHEYGIKLIIVSNNSKKRVEKFCILFNPDDFIYNAKKPFLSKIKRIIKKYNIDLNDAIMLGDQFITDVWVANRLGIKSVLVLPIIRSSNKNIYHDETNFLLRFLENYIYKKIQLTNMFNEITDKMVDKYEIL